MDQQARRLSDINSGGTMLDQFKKSLIQLKPTQDLCTMVLAFVTDFLQARHTGILLWSEKEGAFVIYPADQNREKFMIYDPFLLFLTDNDRIYRKLEFQNDRRAEDPGIAAVRRDGLRFCELTGADLILPLVLNQSLVGVVFAGEDRGSAVDADVLHTLDEVRSLSVMALSNSIIYSRLEGILANLEDKVRERTRELENAQSQLVQSEKMAMLGVMVAGIAHEINTPAGVIQGGVQNIEKNLSYILNNLNIARKSVAPENAETFYRILSQIGLGAIKSREVRDAFKKKKEMASNLESARIEISRELSMFIVENGFFEAADGGNFFDSPFMKDIIELFSKTTREDGLSILAFLNEVANSLRNLQNMQGAIRSIVRIIRALKYYSHLDQGKMVRADLHEGLDNTLIILGSLMKNEVLIEKEYSQLPEIECNPDELNQVWTNLLTNAYQAMKKHPESKIWIRTRRTEDGPAEGVLVEIEDNGPGIPESVLPRIWDPFFTTKDQGEGSGLGLGIVKGIVEKHRGSISVESQTGKGTRFKVRLPVHQEKGDAKVAGVFS